MHYVVFGLLLFGVSGPASAAWYSHADMHLIEGWLNGILFDSILPVMFFVMNTTMALAVLFVVGYTSLTGVLNSAHEGQVMGKAYSSMWVPLRTVIAIVLIMPIPFAGSTGYNTMQVIVFNLAQYGSGFAAQVWDAGMGYIQNNGSLYQPPARTQGKKIATALLKANGCQETVNRSHGEPVIQQQTRTVQSGDEWRVVKQFTGKGSGMFDFFSKERADFTADVSANLPIDACGRLELSLTKPAKEEYADIKNALAHDITKALSELDLIMYDLARGLINDDTFKPSGYELMDAAAAYDKAVNAAIQKAITALNKKRNDVDWQKDARRFGWISAGAYHFDIIRTHEETRDYTKIIPEVYAPLPEVAQGQDYSRNMSYVMAYIGNSFVFDKFGETVRAAEHKPEDKALDVLGKRAQQAVKLGLDYDNPVLGLKAVGDALIDAGIYAVGLATTAKTVSAGAKSSVVGKFVPGAAAVAGAADWIATKLFSGVLWAAILLGIPAVFLAFWLPFSPFVYWMWGVMGWLYLLGKSLLAAPIWAATHALPEGQGMVGQHARRGYLVLVGLIARPTLKLICLFLSIMLTIVGYKILLVMFLPAAQGISGDGPSALVGIGAMIYMFAILAVGLNHIALKLIAEGDTIILRYIGGVGETLGETQIADKAGGNVTAVGGIVQRQAESAKHKQDYKKGRGGEAGQSPAPGGQGGSLMAGLSTAAK